MTFETSHHSLTLSHTHAHTSSVKKKLLNDNCNIFFRLCHRYMYCETLVKDKYFVRNSDEEKSVKNPFEIMFESISLSI